MPRFLNSRSSSLLISSSSTGTTRGSISRIVTSAPKLLKIDANSTPTAPEPITTSDFGISVDLQNLVVRQNRVVRLVARQHARIGARRQHHLLRLDRLGLAIGQLHLDGMNAVLRRAGQLAEALDGRDLVLLHQEVETLDVPRDHVVLARQHALPVQLRRHAVDAVPVGMLQVVPKLRRKQHRLGRNAAPKQASPAQPVVCVDQRGLQAILRGADRAGISGGPAADHYYIKNRICQGNLRFCVYTNILDYASCQALSVIYLARNHFSD